jgi:hypothetical protein
MTSVYARLTYYKLTKKLDQLSGLYMTAEKDLENTSDLVQYNLTLELASQLKWEIKPIIEELNRRGCKDQIRPLMMTTYHSLGYGKKRS